MIGSGPSGFYAAKYLTSSVSKRVASLNDDSSSPPWPFSGVEIDILERLPTPFGLVRYGVAPDHPEVKHVQNDFAAVSLSDTVSYFGNVEAGRDDVVSLSTLSSLYDVVVLAYGCQSDRGLEIPGRNLRGVLTAREFVNWYNGHPEYGYVADVVREARGGNAVVVGNGNVALDCARILAKGREGLRDTDAPGGVLEVLGEGMERVVVAGRRGHVQGAFTIKVGRLIGRSVGLDEFLVGNHSFFESLKFSHLITGITRTHQTTTGRIRCLLPRPTRRIRYGNDGIVLARTAIGIGTTQDEDRRFASRGCGNCSKGRER